MDIKNILFLGLGAALGGVGTFFFMKSRCEQKIADETAAAKEWYEEKLEALNEKENHEARVIAKAAFNKPDLNEVSEIIKKKGYSDIKPSEDKELEQETEEVSNPKKIYIIKAEDYTDDFSHSKETLFYYEEDDVLADESDERVFVNDTIGEEALNHFGEEEDDTVYVRNDSLGIDYEVICQHNSYSRLVEGITYGEE